MTNPQLHAMNDTAQPVQPSLIRKWETMASRIRAGESEDSVLSDYGLARVISDADHIMRFWSDDGSGRKFIEAAERVLAKRIAGDGKGAEITDKTVESFRTIVAALRVKENSRET